MRSGWVPTAAARQAMEERRLAELRFRNGPMALWDRVFGGHLAAEFAKDYTPGEARMTAFDKLRDAALVHAQKGQELRAAALRWRPDPHNPGKALDGSDLDAHPAEFRNRKLKEAQRAIDSWADEAVRTLDPLIAEAEREPRQRLQLGTRLGAADTGEVSLLVQQYQGLTRQQQAELNTLGQAALDRGDLVAALQHKRAAEVLHVNTPELDDALASQDPARASGRSELETVGQFVQAMQADAARVRKAAGVADSTEAVGLQGWAQERGLDPDGPGSFVEAVAGAQ